MMRAWGWQLVLAVVWLAGAVTVAVAAALNALTTGVVSLLRRRR